MFNLTVEGCPEYYAAGVLVHNCDAMRYVCVWQDKRGRSGGGPVAPALPPDARLPAGTFRR